MDKHSETPDSVTGAPKPGALEPEGPQSEKERNKKDAAAAAGAQTNPDPKKNQPEKEKKINNDTNATKTDLAPETLSQKTAQNLNNSRGSSYSEIMSDTRNLASMIDSFKEMTGVATFEKKLSEENKKGLEKIKNSGSPPSMKAAEPSAKSEHVPDLSVLSASGPESSGINGPTSNNEIDEEEQHHTPGFNGS